MLVMAPLAQCLVVLRIPKQLGLSLVRHDVVNDCCFNSLTKGEVHRTEWMLNQELFPILLPAAVVTALRRSFTTV